MQTHCQSYVQPTGCTNIGVSNPFLSFIYALTQVAELNVDSDSDLNLEEVELNKLDQSQATLLQSIIQCREDDIVNTSCQGSAILQLLETIQNKIEQDEWKLLGKELLQMVITCVSGPSGMEKIALSQVWRNFHVCRLSPVIRARWNSCVGMLHIPYPRENKPTLFCKKL